MLRGFYDSMLEARAGRRVEEVMDRANEILEGHGVEAMRSEGAYVDAYHGDIIATYVNMGDTYNGTIVHDSADNSFHLTTYGDWLEQWETANLTGVCTVCGRTVLMAEIDADSEVCDGCRLHVWSPDEGSLIVVLRSESERPVYVHLWRKEPLTFAFSSRLSTGEFTASHEIEARKGYYPFRYSMDQLTDWFGLAIERSQLILTQWITQARPGIPRPSSMPPAVTLFVSDSASESIDLDQWKKLLVALDAFQETGWKYQPVKEFLEFQPSR